MTEKVLVTGGVGFIGSHVAEFYAEKGADVTVLDNLSRENTARYNWNYLRENYAITLIRGDIRNQKKVEELIRNKDLIVNCAAQVAVTTSIENPREDFESNTLGTFNILEGARNSEKDPTIIHCSTNKVYGENVNELEVEKKKNRYVFFDKKYREGIPENFSIDLCEHTPYGCSKLAGDIYMQDYAKLYGLKTGIFRMSCIYGTRQFGTEDQGWLAHFAISTLQGNPITIYGDGKQVRDVLYITDLLNVYDLFKENSKKFRGEVFNIGGGRENTVSLLELLNILEEKIGKRSKITFEDWRPSDQKVYISDISKAK
ncbi:MAG: nucleoside-diphosphate sugar epimerase, partial [Candidatus Hydrothermota bacterium]